VYFSRDSSSGFVAVNLGILEILALDEIGEFGEGLESLDDDDGEENDTFAVGRVAVELLFTTVVLSFTMYFVVPEMLERHGEMRTV
jgi:hypothetical protein